MSITPRKNDKLGCPSVQSLRKTVRHGSRPKTQSSPCRLKGRRYLWRLDPRDARSTVRQSSDPTCICSGAVKPSQRDGRLRISGRLRKLADFDLHDSHVHLQELRHRFPPRLLALVDDVLSIAGCGGIETTVDQTLIRGLDTAGRQVQRDCPDHDKTAAAMSDPRRRSGRTLSDNLYVERGHRQWDQQLALWLA
mgnify:CR=1 FL=1